MGFMASRWVPMAAIIEVSEFPVADGHGVRLLYGVGYRFAPATEVVLRALASEGTLVREMAEEIARELAPR